MPKRKTEFELEYNNGIHCGWIRIGLQEIKEGKLKHKEVPYIYILTAGKEPMFIKEKDLKRFATNILKSIK
jgi:hypothetical protein